MAPLLQTILPMLLGNLLTRGQRIQEAEKRQQEIDFQKEQLKAMRQQIKMTNEVYESVQDAAAKGFIPREAVPMIISDPKGPLARIWQINLLGQGQKPEPQFIPESTPEPYETPTGKYLPATQQTQQPNLLGQLTEGQIGIDPKQFVYGQLEKDYGIPNPTTRVTREMKFIPDKGWMMVDVNKFGQMLPGSEGPLPPNYKEFERDIAGVGRIQGIMDINTGNIIPNTVMPKAQEFTRERTIGGPSGVLNVPVPKLFMPGETPPTLAEPTKLEMRREQLPSGAEVDVPYNPYQRWATPGQAISTEGPKGAGGQSTGGLAKQPEVMLPIKMDDLVKWIHPKTLAHPQPGISPQRATKQGFYLVSTQAMNDIENIKNMEQPIKELLNLMHLVFGPESEAKKGTWIGQKAEGWVRYFEGLTEKNIDAADYKRLADSTLSIWARGISSEKGNLNEGDVKRAKGLIGDLTSRPEVAWRSMRRLQRLVAAIKERKIKGTYDDEPTLIPGEEEVTSPKTAEEYLNKWR